MGVLRLALRGLWFRRGVSLAVLVVAALVVGAAAAGPLFLRAAGESVLRDTLTQALLPSRVVNDRVRAPLSGDPLSRVEKTSATRVAERPTMSRLLSAPTVSLAVRSGAAATGRTPETVQLVYRDGVCFHIRMVEGVCAQQPGTVMISDSTLQIEGWGVGQRLTMNGVPVIVAGSYVPLAINDDYWGENFYFAAGSPAGVKGGNDDSSLDAVFAPLDTVGAQPAGQLATATTDRRLDLSAIRLSDVPALHREVSSYVTDVGGVPINTGNSDVSVSSLVVVLDDVVRINQALLLPVVAVEAQLLVLCWLVLFSLVANAAEARGPEVALAKLRGRSSPATLAFGLLDTLLLVVVAVPAGFGLAWLLVTALTRTELAPGTPVLATAAAVLATLAAGAGAAVAAVLAAAATLRRPVVEQWRRATRRVRARSWMVDLGVGAAAVAGLVALARAGAVRLSVAAGGEAGARTPLALIAPGLLIVTIALVGSRVLPMLCRGAYGPTRDRGWTASMLAVRQLGRRPSTLRLALVVAVAFGLVTFGVDALAVGRANAHDRAWTETGAAQVLTVATPPGVDVADVVATLDPTGRQATVVSTVTDFAMPPSVLLMGVRPDQFARVAYWRSDFGPAALADLTSRLAGPTAAAVVLGGDRLRVDATTRGLTADHPALLVADVSQPNDTTGTTRLALGLVRAGTHRLEVALPCQPQACRLAGLHLERTGPGLYPIRGELTVTGVDVRARRGGDWQAVPADLTVPGGWRPVGPVNAPTAARGSAAPGPGGLVLTADTDLAGVPAWQVADYTTPVPAVLTSTAADLRGDTVAGFGGQPLPLRPVALTSVLPSGADRGVLVDRTSARRAAGGATNRVVETVWLTEQGAATLPQQLEQAGVTILSTDSAQQQAELYQRQGPELAILLFAVGAVLAAVLAGGGAVLNLHLTGRRRTYELAAMAALGVRRRTLFAALVVEQALLMGFGVLVGALSGLLAAKLALPAVPEFADTPAAPPLLFGIHPAPVLVSLAVAVAVLSVVVVASSANLVRGARFEQLREAAA